MAGLRETLADRIPGVRENIKALLAEHGDTVISTVTVAQAFGGMRGVKGMICETSVVDPEKGLIIRGHPISELSDRLPEEIFFLLCTGDLPDAAALAALQSDLRERAAVPDYVWKVLHELPKDSHPMEMFGTAILILEHESVADCAVVGIPDEQWGEAVAAIVVTRADHAVSESELQVWVKDRLRSSRTPSRIEFRNELPYNETGKLLRRKVRAELLGES